MWLHIETFVFFGSIVSGVVYMCFRAFVPNAHDLGEYLDVFNEKTDHLAANAINIEMFEAYFCPLFATILLWLHGGYVIPENVVSCSKFFFWTQIV